MPRREKDDGNLINNTSKSAIEKALGRSVKLEPANDEPIRQQVEEFDAPVEASNVSVSSIAAEEEVIAEKPKTTNVTPYGDNYYKINLDDLPTRGKLYGGNEIYLRNFKVIEIKRLSTVDEATANDVINDVMGKLVKGVDYDKITAVDKIALLFYVRMNTFPDPRYKINFSCTNAVPDGQGGRKECAHQNQLFFTANDLDVNQVDEDFRPDDLKFNLPNGDEIVWRFPIVSDEKGVVIAVDKIKIEFESNKEYKDIEVDTDIVSYSYVIETINGVTLSTIDKYLYITEVLSPQDFIVLTKQMNNRFDIGVNTMVKTTCSECGGRVSVPVMFSPEFFLPEYTSA